MINDKNNITGSFRKVSLGFSGNNVSARGRVTEPFSIGGKEGGCRDRG
jgi:hypothetical protein